MVWVWRGGGLFSPLRRSSYKALTADAPNFARGVWLYICNLRQLDNLTEALYEANSKAQSR